VFLRFVFYGVPHIERVRPYSTRCQRQNKSDKIDIPKPPACSDGTCPNRQV
jgi:hypothetical protein